MNVSNSIESRVRRGWAGLGAAAAHASGAKVLVWLESDRGRGACGSSLPLPARDRTRTSGSDPPHRKEIRSDPSFLIFDQT